MDRLRALYFEGKLEEVEKECLKELQANPGEVDIRVTLANVYRKRGVDADADWEGRSLDPGQQLPGAASLARAVEELKTALQAAPERRDVWFGLCQMERERRDITGLVSCTESALQRFPEDPDLGPDLLSNLRPLVERSEFADAASALEPLAKKYPKSRETMLTYARSLYLSGRRAEGLDAIAKLSEILPEDPEVLYQRADLSAFDGDFVQAGIYFARASRLRARGGLGLLGAVASMHVLDPPAALQMIRSTLNNWKNERVRAADAAFSVQATMRKFDGVLAALPPSAQDTFLFAQELDQIGSPAGALAETVAALKLDPQIADARVLQGGLYARMERHDEAAAALTLALKALDENPDRSFGVTRDEILLALGREQYRLGKYEDALAAFRKTSRPGEHAWDTALATERLGRREEAARLLRKVVESGSPSEAEQARRRLAAPPYKPAP
jgi:tetratricopeptide (TPR) repeat protein